MKKLVGLLLCLVLAFCLVGCGIKNEFEVGGESDVVVTEGEVELSIKEGTLSNTGAVLVLKNNSGSVIYYGNPFEIEIKEDGEWHKINVELTFTMEVYGLNPGEEKEIDLNWEYGYGKLAKGEYRIIKDYTGHRDENDENKELFVSVEFTI